MCLNRECTDPEWRLPRRRSVLLFCCSLCGCLHHTVGWQPPPLSWGSCRATKPLLLNISVCPMTRPCIISPHNFSAFSCRHSVIRQWLLNMITPSAPRDSPVCQDRHAELIDKTKRRRVMCVTCSRQGVDTTWNCTVSTSNYFSTHCCCCRHQRPNCWPSLVVTSPKAFLST